MLRALWHRITRPSSVFMSSEWLSAHDQRTSSRVDFDGPRWQQWPVDKLKNESARWNAKRLRRPA